MQGVEKGTDAMNRTDLRELYLPALVGLAILNGCLVTILTAGASVHLYRAQALQSAIERAGGHASWSDSWLTFICGLRHQTRAGMKTLAWRGVLPTIHEVKIFDRELSDDELEFLGTLTSLKRLELQCNTASDAVLATISRLPNLEYLRIRGKNFTAEGMLKLRALPALEQVEFDGRLCSPIELAVLEMEIPGLTAWNPSPVTNGQVSQGRQIAGPVTIELQAPLLL